MEKTNKEYYTFAEIITGLREGYKKSQHLLNRLHQYIEIVSRFDNNSNLSLCLGNDSSLEFAQAKILLQVSKNPSSIGNLLRNAMNNYTFNEVRWLIDNASFTLVEEADSLNFNQNNHLKLQDIYKPNVHINNKDEFTSIYTELKSTELFALPSLYIEINPYQSLYVWGDSIYLSRADEKGKEKIDIQYVAKDDNIIVKSNTRYSNYFIERLLETKIPKYEFPCTYLSLLESNDDKNDTLIVADKVGRKKENFHFKNKRKRLVLTNNQ